MQIYNERQQKLAEKIDSEVIKKNWKDWKWQMKHLIKDIDTFQKVTGIDFPKKEKEELKETLSKFPFLYRPIMPPLSKKMATKPIRFSCNVFHHRMNWTFLLMTCPIH